MGTGPCPGAVELTRPEDTLGGTATGHFLIKASSFHTKRFKDLSRILQVKESGILASLDPGQRRLQEALFEIVSSEASYLKVVLID